MSTNREPLLIFLADLHLTGDADPHARTFRALLAHLAHTAKEQPVELYLLGDVFEFWDEYHAQVIARYRDDLAALAAAHQAGLRIHLADGNRDFLYGSYVQHCFSANLLGDGARVELAPDLAAWVEHGDLICRADVRYLRYRRRVRSTPVKMLFRLLPWFIAGRLVARISRKSKADCTRKAPQEFEPDLAYARERLHNTSTNVLICGHTHKPRDEDLGGSLRLIVLPPWCETQAAYRFSAGKLERICVAADGSFQTDETST